MALKKKAKKIYVGLKYCGGCSAQFDRVALVDEIKNRLPQDVVLIPVSDNVDLILIVAGCESACVNTSQFGDKEIFIIFRREHAEAFTKKMVSMEKFDELGENL